MVNLVMVAGVSGAGKSTVGSALAQRLGVPFVDADSLHSAANVAKMAAGTPLNDDDRQPWLQSIGREMSSRSEGGLVIACSALKFSYRELIRAQAPTVCFIMLDGSAELITRRLTARENHFMPAALLSSQLAALEPLRPGERGAVISIADEVELVIDRAVSAIKSIAPSIPSAARTATI